MVFSRFFQLAVVATTLLFLSSCISLPKYPYIDPSVVVTKDVGVNFVGWVWQKKNLKKDFYVVEDAKEVELVGSISFERTFLTLNYSLKEGGEARTFTFWYDEELNSEYLKENNLQITGVEMKVFYESKKKGLEIYWPFEVVVTLQPVGGGTPYKVRKAYHTFERR